MMMVMVVVAVVTNESPSSIKIGLMEKNTMSLGLFVCLFVFQEAKELKWAM